MTGLIIKDFRLMLQRTRSLIIIIACGLVMGIVNDVYFLVGWLMLIGSIFSLSTIAYDEYDNCYPFLMTMPITRKTYAVEKYIFGMLCGLSFWVFSVIFCFIVQLIKKAPINPVDDLIPLITVLFVPVFILDFSIPVNLKYGTERSRVVLLIIWGILFSAFFIASRLIPGGVNFDAIDAFLSGPMILGIMLIASIIITAVSIVLSIHVMENKEF